jgi:uncharacterized protein
MTNVAIIGSGVAGLSAAWHLANQSAHPITISLFEKDARLGGHANTVQVSLDGIQAPVDTGFLVCNERTYPLFIPFLKEIGVPLALSDMSFAISVGPHEFEWCGSNLNGLFAQRRNLLSLRFWGMLKDIVRFNKQATALAGDLLANQTLNMPLGEFLKTHRYSDAFRDDYLVPMAAAIWSCPTKTMLNFPIGSFVRFFDNHGLLQISNRPRWFTIQGGAKQYVDKIAQSIVRTGGLIHLNTEAHSIRRSASGAEIQTQRGIEHFDHLIMACHSDQALALLGDASAEETGILKAIPYQPNTAYLHTDAALMPKRRNAWAAWNYLTEKRASDQPQSVSVTYWLNRLQPLPFSTPLFVSLNPIHAPKAESIIQTFGYEHPVFDLNSPKAQADLSALQGKQNTWFAGAWTGYGFHEDGFRSGKTLADGLLAQLSTQPSSRPSIPSAQHARAA